jgi:hypothetical protein
VDGIGSGLCPVVGFGIRCVESFDSATRKLVLLTLYRHSKLHEEQQREVTEVYHHIRDVPLCPN